MNVKKIQTVFLAAASLFSSAVFAQHASDIIPGKLRVVAKSAALPGIDLSRDTVHFSWNLGGDAIKAPTPHVAESREFYMDVDAASLRKGVTVRTTAKGSVVKLSPVGAVSKAKSLVTDDVTVRVNGAEVGLADFAARVDDSRKLAASDVGFAPGSLAFSVNDDNGPVEFEVALKSADQGYLVHVFEPASSNVLTLTTSRDSYLVGENIELIAGASNGAAISEISGGIASPGGEITAVKFARDANGRFIARVPLSASAVGALYEAFAVAKLDDGSVVALRDAKTGFAVAEPTARLRIALASAGGQQTQTFNIALDVAVEGRYQAEAVLFGLQDGVRVPVAIAHTGAWLEAGEQTVALRFDNLDLAKRGISGPFAIGHFALKNQATFGTMERRLEVATRDRFERSFD
jgi:hypothetical protein